MHPDRMRYGVYLFEELTEMQRVNSKIIALSSYIHRLASKMIDRTEFRYMKYIYDSTLVRTKTNAN